MVYVVSTKIEPSKAPANVTAFLTGPKSIAITWKPVPGPNQNGLIKGYTVYYRVKLGDMLNCAGQSLKTNGSVTRVEVSHLELQVTYIVSVSANTSIGEGPRSNEVLVRTAQASKCQQQMKIE